MPDRDEVAGTRPARPLATQVADAVELARSLDRLPGRLDVYAIEGASFVAGDSPEPVGRAGRRRARG